jgi:hypothetical protein
MEYSPSEAGSHSSRQEVPRLLWNQKVGYHLLNNLVMSHFYPVHTLTTCFCKIKLNVIVLSDLVSISCSVVTNFHVS